MRKIALLRGIELDDQERTSNLLPLLTSQGLEDVQFEMPGQAFIFESEGEAEELGDRIKQILRKEFQVRPRVLVIDSARLTEVVEDNPFESAAPDQIHILFLRRYPVRPNFQQMERFKGPKERWTLTDFAFYLHTPDQWRSSKLGVRAERLLGVTGIRRSLSQTNGIAGRL